MMVYFKLIMVKCSLMMVKCSLMMVKWIYDHTLITPSLTSILPSSNWSKPSFAHLIIIEKLHRLLNLCIFTMYFPGIEGNGDSNLLFWPSNHPVNNLVFSGHEQKVPVISGHEQNYPVVPGHAEKSFIRDLDVEKGGLIK